MTYEYYRQNIKPKPGAGAQKKKGWLCTVCGYIYEGEVLPPDFICPVCKHGAEVFVPLDSEEGAKVPEAPKQQPAAVEAPKEPTTTPEAPKPESKPEPEKKKGFVCGVCGYVLESDTLPPDFICPVCKHGAEVLRRWNSGRQPTHSVTASTERSFGALFSRTLASSMREVRAVPEGAKKPRS